MLACRENTAGGIEKLAGCMKGDWFKIQAHEMTDRKYTNVMNQEIPQTLSAISITRLAAVLQLTTKGNISYWYNEVSRGVSGDLIYKYK